MSGGLRQDRGNPAFLETGVVHLGDDHVGMDAGVAGRILKRENAKGLVLFDIGPERIPQGFEFHDHSLHPLPERHI